MEDNVVESIKIMGHDVRYLPREVYDAQDNIFGESVNSKFTRAYNIEMYLANVEGYEGDGDFFSKFGLEIRDTSNFVVSRRSFERYVPSSIARRPREGDLIYVPVLDKIFEIKFVEEELMFFSLGKKTPYIYELRCEVFRYSNEDLDTGVEVIDDIEVNNGASTDIEVVPGSGNYYINERVYQGANVASATATGYVKSWNSGTNRLLVYNVVGQFADVLTVVGETSNTSRVVAVVNELYDNGNNDIYDNFDIETEADLFVDFTETNPFGMP
jgi:hypothetical protein